MAQSDDAVGEILERIHAQIEAHPVVGVAIGTLFPAVTMLNHRAFEWAVASGWLFSGAVWLSLLIGAVSPIVGLLIAMYSLRAMPALPVRVRPFLIMGCCVLMILALVAVSRFRG